MFKILFQIKALVKNNTTAINKLAQRVNGGICEDASVEEFGFPMGSIESVRNVENMLEEKQKMKHLVI